MNKDPHFTTLIHFCVGPQNACLQPWTEAFLPTTPLSQQKSSSHNWQACQRLFMSKAPPKRKRKRKKRYKKELFSSRHTKRCWSFIIRVSRWGSCSIVWRAYFSRSSCHDFCFLCAKVFFFLRYWVILCRSMTFRGMDLLNLPQGTFFRGFFLSAKLYTSIISSSCI